MRKYEEKLLKYFYTVAEFADVAAADAVYDQCDGVQFEWSGPAMDLRFVPDEMKMDAPVRDSASSVPDESTPPNLAPSTLKNCKLKLSRDADAPDRVVLMKRAFGKHEEGEANLKAYLAGASGSEGDGKAESHRHRGEGQNDIESKRALVLGITGHGAESDGDSARDEDMEMEVTFEPGLAEKGEEIIKRKEERDSRVEEAEWDSRLRRIQARKAEKRKARKAHAKSTGVGASGDGDTSDGSGSVSDGERVQNIRDSSQIDEDPFSDNSSSGAGASDKFSCAGGRASSGTKGDRMGQSPNMLSMQLVIIWRTSLERRR